MYCRRCGKYIESESLFCEECLEKENVAKKEDVAVFSKQNTQENIEDKKAEELKDKGKITTGLVKSIVGFVLAYFGTAIFAFASVVIEEMAIFSCLGEVYELAEISGLFEDLSIFGTAISHGSWTSILLVFLALLVSGAMFVVATIFGLLSIRCFFQEKKEGRKKPIPTLVIGAVTLADSVPALLGCISSILILFLTIIA